MNADGTGQRQVTDLRDDVRDFVVSPDGSRAAMTIENDFDDEASSVMDRKVAVVNLDGSGFALLTDERGVNVVYDWR
jgi:hypothetical protein